MTGEPEQPGPSEVVAEIPAGHFITFWDFFEGIFVPKMKLELPCKQAHKHVCDTLEEAFLGMLLFAIIIINIPPRVGKTKLMQAFACWIWAYFPDAQLIFTSYAGPLAEESLAYIAKVLRSPWFIELYGDRLHDVRADHLTSSEGGNIYGEGVLGELTGKGAGLKRPAGGAIVIDDPAKPNEALSPVVSQRLRDWYDLTLRSRRNSTEFTPIILCAQRLGPDDLCGHLLKTYPEDCYLIKEPGIKHGVSQFPETFTAEDAEKLNRTRIGRFVFASQIQQEPVTLGGNLIPTDKFNRFDLRDARSMKFQSIAITVDTAMKTKEWNDYSALEAWGLSDRRAYLLDLMWGKLESPELLANTSLFWTKLKADYPLAPLRLVIEEKAAGTGLVQQLRVNGIPAIGIERDIDKARRVKLILPYIETGLVYIPKDGQHPLLAAFLEECGGFKEDMTHAHDDLVDAMADGLTQQLGKPLSTMDVLGLPRRR